MAQLVTTARQDLRCPVAFYADGKDFFFFIPKEILRSGA